MSYAHNAVLFYDSGIVNLDRAIMALRAIGSPCIVASSLEDLAEQMGNAKYVAVIVDVSAYLYLLERGLHLQSRAPVLILSQQRFREIWPELEKIPSFTFFVAKDEHGAFSPHDLLIILKKVRQFDLFGLKKYLGWGATTLSFQVRDTPSRVACVDEVLQYCREIGLRRSILDSAYRLCEELLTNALFDAPIDQYGNARFRRQARSEGVSLSSMEAPVLEVGFDGATLGIGVSDPFGSITRDKVMSYIFHCFAGDEPDLSANTSGAGMGLYLCFNSVSNFVINVNPMTRTEVIGLIDVTLSPSEYFKRHASFQYFSTVPQPSGKRVAGRNRDK